MNKTFILDQKVPIEYFFEKISSIARNIGEEKNISNYIVDFAKEKNFWVHQDNLWNVIIKKPATKGYENSSPVILQAHLDMVCIKTPENPHDFEKDPIELIVDNGNIIANGTTLGADDGYGIAYILAILDNKEIEHPPLECVFTTQEESENVGVQHLNFELLNGKRIIGLDIDSEHSTYVSCFCSDKIILEKNFKLNSHNGLWCQLSIINMESDVIAGVIHPECGNAIKIIARLLNSLLQHDIQIYIKEMYGGLRENSIPLQCKTEFAFDKFEFDKVKYILENEFSNIKNEMGMQHFKADLSMEKSYSNKESIDKQCLSSTDSETIVNVLYMIPNNLFQYDIEKNEVISINNVGLLKIIDGQFELTSSARSRYTSSEQQLVEHIKLIAKNHKLNCVVSERYRTWKYNEDSELRKIAAEILLEEQKVKLHEDICLGGLELAYFSKQIPELDVFCLGADVQNCHTTSESLNLKSFHRSYGVLLKILKRLL